MTTSENDDGVKKQLLFTVSRANQCTSVIRAIMLSNNSDPHLFGHLYGTQYLALVIDISKLFDKSWINLRRFLEIFKNELIDKEYDAAIIRLETIESKNSLLLKQINSLRNNLGAHLNREALNKIFKDPHSSEYVVDLNRVQSLLKDIVDLLISLNFINKTESQFLLKKTGPNDVMELFGLKMK